MDFQQLLAKMQELDTPTRETSVAEEPTITDEGGCGMDSAMPTPMNMAKPDEPPPSMSINLNAQGLDNIEELMKLIKAVNPDAEKSAMPPMPMSLPPLKMLPDLSDEPHMEPDGDEGPEPKMPPDLDGDEEKKKEAYANEPAEDEADVADITDSGDDLHRKKMMFKATAGGDNPMATEGSDLRSQIRAELLRRLEEAKGAK